ncbi:SEFIR domain-containing protein [Paenibacillus aquistagni]|uniref:SEFIR domain-containing protein n=1 Tax=Paenibacillus aquistagni TaxID=1852522 RepID=UPI000B4FDE7F|nr:SEFIR domain-containing protein [Paenibacillus aquistagni]
MTQKAIVNPKVFVSYSWTTPEHEEWVVDLATRLRSDGVDVILDKWHLREGQDIYAFMESMVTSDTVDKVLIICDEGYQKRADNRVGGVGTETQIITPQTYSDANQEKFIPIVAERSDVGEHFIPTYMKTRLYIDLSSYEKFEENYEILLRNIYRVPIFKLPVLGKAPAYLFQSEGAHFQTAKILRQMKVSADKYPNRMKHHWNDFVESFCESLSEFKIREIDEISNMDDRIIELIEEMRPLRDDFIEAVEILCMTGQFRVSSLVEFFEKVYSFTEASESGCYHAYQFDHFKFTITELYLYSATILFREKNYVDLSKLLSSEYYFESKYGNRHPKHFYRLRFYLKTLEYRKEKLSLNRLDLQADLLIQRSIGKYKKDLILTDILLYNISKFHSLNEMGVAGTWFPHTYIYFEEDEVFKLFAMLKSKSHYEEVKVLFNNVSIEQFKTKVATMEGDRGHYSAIYGTIPLIRSFIKVEDIGTKP